MSERRPRSGPVDWADLGARLARTADALRHGARPSAGSARATLERRAAALARPPPAPGAAAVLEAVAFDLGGEAYALEAALVREVIRPAHVTRLPGAPAFLAGVVNHRGAVLDVLDVRGFLGAGAPQAGAEDAARLLVLGDGEDALALRVDAVHGLVALDASALVPAPESAARSRPEYLRGLAPPAAGGPAPAPALPVPMGASGPDPRVALLDAATLLQDPRLVADDAPDRHEVTE